MTTRSPGVAESLAHWILSQAQKTTRKGTGGYSVDSFAARGDQRPFPQAELERSQVDDFFKLFPGFPVCDAIRGRDVLDFGSGYGGKTVEYRLRCGGRRVCGVEPFANMIDASRRYADAQSAGDVEFQVCSHRTIPYADRTFDVVLSHDVLEHVEDPRQSVAEIYRVLRPGGLAFNVFPLYFGAMSHHLDYVTRLPGLHWLFSPHTLVGAVNRLLAANPQFGTAAQPAPRRSFDGEREVLPGLNGLSGVHLEALFVQFERVYFRRIALGPRGMGLVVNSRLPVYVRDMATATVVCVLRKAA